MILFKKQFKAQLINGEKTSTIRKTFSGVPAIGKIMKTNFEDVALKVIDKKRISINDFTDEIARADGFKNKDELKKAIASFYPNIDTFCYIQFEKKKKI